MYLTIKQHDAFRNLLMGFEIPYRKYIADVVIYSYQNTNCFENKMRSKNAAIDLSSPKFLKDVLPQACRKNKLESVYKKLETAKDSTEEIVSTDLDIPMVGALNLVTFALSENFRDLYALFGSYTLFCECAEAYRYARNKLDHPGSRTLEDTHLTPVLSFVKDICRFLDDSFFIQKTRNQLLSEATSLQQRRLPIPVNTHNFAEMPYSDSHVVCRDTEIQFVKNFVYGKPEDLRKQHSCCIYGYGGVGKTALVLEVLKQVICDIQDGTTINEYSPKYILFYSAKKRKLSLASETGKFVEQPMRSHFDTIDELKKLIFSSLHIDNLRGFHDEGIVVVDNLETLSPEERKYLKTFVETQTPSEMQFLLTSRNSEEYETNYKLDGFNSQNGISFIEAYSKENALDLELSEDESNELLSLSKGNTLVLVLCMRRLSKNLSSFGSLMVEFNASNAWKSLKSSLSKTPSNAYEVIGEFMYKDTFEHIETSFEDNSEWFYKVLKVFAVIQSESIDINTLCLLTNESYPNIETVVDILCNFLILEKKDTQYSLNEFAEKYIVGRFLPDAETYNRLSQEIVSRQRRVSTALEELDENIKNRPSLAKIIKDWLIITDVDKITAAEMFKMYGEVDNVCRKAGKFKMEGVLEDFIKKCDESERLTAHPYIKYQKCRILRLVDSSNILEEKHVDEIIKGFNDAVYSIKTIDQYVGIQQTKSYASLLWLYGQYLSDINKILDAMRYLEESKSSFEELEIKDQEYYQCSTKLGWIYLDYYLQDRSNRLSYLRRARGIMRTLNDNWKDLGRAKIFAGQLKTRLTNYGDY